MTLPCERHNAIRRTEEFLKDLMDPKKTPRVPKEIRKQAYYCLKHYPGEYHLKLLATKCPEVLDSGDKLDDLTVLLHDYEQRRQDYG